MGAVNTFNKDEADIFMCLVAVEQNMNDITRSLVVVVAMLVHSDFSSLIAAMFHIN